MPSHKFRVGQIVGILASPGSEAPTTRSFKVLQLLPPEAGQCGYLIKTISESMARIVRESEIDARR